MLLRDSANAIGTQNGGKWSLWTYVPVTSFVTDPSTEQLKKFSSSFGVVPNNIVPSNKFWIQAPMSNCDFPLPWENMSLPDPFALAASGTLVGAMAGLEIAGMDQSRATYHDLATSIPSPIIGYCVNDIFSERLYTKLNVFTTSGFGSIYTADVNSWDPDVRQKYIIKRFYIRHGEITGVYKGEEEVGLSDDEYAIGLGINGELDSSLLKKTTTINVVTKSGNRLSLKVKRFLTNWHAVIERSGDAPSNGDFYFLDDVLVIDDPLLMGGLWLGDEKNATLAATSGYDLFATSNQISYSDINFVGGYAFKEKTSGEFVNGGVGQSMNDNGDFTWAWCLFSKMPAAGRRQISDSYGDEFDRIKWEYVINPKEVEGISSSTINQYVSKHTVRDTCSSSGVLYGVKNGGNHVRLEIAECGSPFRNNFHSPILKGEYIYQNGNAFKILDQVDGATLDIEYIAVDGKTTLDIQSPCKLFNQYAWKINEHYNAFNVKLFGSGVVTSASASSISIEMKESDMGSGTYSAWPYKNLEFDYLEKNTFTERFFKDIPESPKQKKMYIKGQRWLLDCRDSSGKNTTIPVKSIKYDGTSTKDGAVIYNVTIIPTQDLTSVSENLQGNSTRIFFDKPYTIDGYTGGVFMEYPEQNKTTGHLYLDANLLSPIVSGSLPASTTVGVCDSSWWWFTGKIMAFFIKVPKGVPSTSCFFSDNPYMDVVLYKDYLSEKLTIRCGTLECRENPAKIEVAIGEKKREDTSGPEIKLNDKAERLNAIYLYELPEAQENEKNYLTFSAGTKNNLIGFFVGGEGAVDMQPFRMSAETTFKSSDFMNSGEIVSPIYVYTKSLYNQSGNKKVHIGIKTSDGPIIVNKGIDGTSNAEKITALYVNENQTIDSVPFGIHKLSDGEKIIVYSKAINYKIKIGDTAIDTSKWEYSSYAIMVTGSPDFYDGWGTPFVKKPAMDGGAWTIPVMLANCCEYLDSILYRDILFVFAKCFDEGGTPFVGMFRVRAQDLASNIEFGRHEELSISAASGTLPTFSSTKYKDKDIPFWYRAFSDKEAAFTQSSNKINLSGSVNVAVCSDGFKAIMGGALINTVKPDIESVSDWGVLSSYKLDSGYIVLFYNNAKGLTFAFSNSLGNTWVDSGVVLAEDGSCGFMLDGDWLYYLVPGVGLCLKRTGDVLLDRVINMVQREGTGGANIEVLQKEIDDLPRIPIGTGALNSQKFSGYVTNTGIYKIFYYSNEGKLVCVQSKNEAYWSIAENF